MVRIGCAISVTDAQNVIFADTRVFSIADIIVVEVRGTVSVANAQGIVQPDTGVFIVTDSVVVQVREANSAAYAQGIIILATLIFFGRIGSKLQAVSSVQPSTSLASHTPSSSLSLSTMSPPSQVSHTPSTKVQSAGRCLWWDRCRSCRPQGRTTGDFVGITHAVVVAVVVHDEPSFAGLAHAVHEGAERRVAVGGGIAVVVAGRGSVQPVTSLASHTPSSSLSLSTIEPSSRRSHTRRLRRCRAWVAVCGGIAVVVAGCGSVQPVTLVGITHAVVVAVVVDDESAFTGLTHAVHEGAERWSLSVVGCVVVAGRGIGTTGDSLASHTPSSSLSLSTMSPASQVSHTPSTKVQSVRSLSVVGSLS